MNKIFENIQGDKTLWAILILLACFSFLPVYSAASNLAYVSGSGNTFNFLFKHFIHLSLGFTFMYIMQKIPYHYFRGISILMIPVVIVLLLYTLLQPSVIDSLTNTNRWIKIPLVGFTFQPSTLASVILMIYVSRYLAKIKDVEISFSKTILPFWIPILTILLLILPANFSTTAILFSMIILLCFVGGYPLKYLLGVIISGILVLTIFILTVKAYPGIFPNRVDTWKSRIENFVNKENSTQNYQIEKAKIAIATGGVKGLGPGKSVQKNFLPQSSSDFIFAIIIEEYGLIGGLSILLAYTLFLLRIIIISNKSESVFGSLLVIGLGIPIVFQALINIGVSVELFPVTGQPLPLISSGGTSIWMTCIAIGIIQSVRNGAEVEINNDMDDNPLEILKETI
ncbi:MAG: FtsW/RodA/SpoVE family cell cycle protein [Flavobacteriaceae bacterium]|tara:strand:- start:756 stop:1949 length:1194 start_codon:yes stop_codon:yes gene_type:complete